MNVPFLTSPPVELRPYEREHIPQTVEWLQAPFIKETFGLTDVVSIKKHHDWLEKNKDILKWAIYLDKYIGNVLLFPNLKHSSGYLQIYIGSQEAQGKGVGKLTMKAVLDYVFQELSWNRIWLHCLQSNLRAKGLYEKLGFKLEGLERESVHRDGHFICQEVWSLLKRDWEMSRVER